MGVQEKMFKSLLKLPHFPSFPASSPLFRHSGGILADGDATPESCRVTCMKQGMTKDPDKKLAVGIAAGKLCLCGHDLDTLKASECELKQGPLDYFQLHHKYKWLLGYFRLQSRFSILWISTLTIRTWLAQYFRLEERGLVRYRRHDEMYQPMRDPQRVRRTPGHLRVHRVRLLDRRSHGVGRRAGRDSRSARRHQREIVYGSGEFWALWNWSLVFLGILSAPALHLLLLGELHA